MMSLENGEIQVKKCLLKEKVIQRFISAGEPWQACIILMASINTC